VAQDVAAALEGLAKDTIMAVASVPRILEAQPLVVRTEPTPQEVRAETSTLIPIIRSSRLTLTCC